MDQVSIARVHYVKAARQRFAKVAKVDEEGKQVVTPVTRKSGAPRTAKSGRQVVRRIKVADKSKPLPNDKCGKCGDEILPGMPYRWWTVGFRSSYVSRRCMKSTCSPKQSELESSQLSELWAAQEDAEDALNAMDTVRSVTDAEDAVQDILNNVAEVADDLASRYREADEAFGGGGATESGEKADNLEAVSSDLGSFSLNLSDPEGCGEEVDGETHDEPVEGCDDCEANVDAFTDEVRTAAQDALSDALSNV
jgi:hypothetical protein